MMRFLIFIFILNFFGTLGQFSDFIDYKKIQCISVGISDYKNIRSLNFAHNDARSFAEFVAKNELWSGDKEIRLLTNESATAGNIIATFNYCLDRLNSGDLFIFFFAGHGDTEFTDGDDRGESFLLAHDAPKNTYQKGGAISAKDLQYFIQKVIEKDANAILIIDACRAGNFDLAGSLEGVVSTHEGFYRKSTKNEIRILSSQDDQNSQEDGNLGNGRGVFSYFLEEGLTGLSDYSGDSLIQMNELDMYVTNNVKKYTNQRQIPKFEIDDSSYPFSSIISKEQNENSLDLQKIVVGLRSVESKKSNSCSKTLNEFYDQSMNKGFSIDSLFILYNEYRQCEPGDHSTILYELKAVLISELHQIIISSLSGKEIFNRESCSRGLQIIDSLTQMNDEDLDFYKETLYDSQLFLESMDISLFENAPNNIKLDKLKRNLLIRYNLNNDSPLLAISLAGVYSELSDVDSCIYFLLESSKTSPTWLFPKYQLLKQYRKNGNKNEAYGVLDEVFNLDTTYRDYECVSCFFQEVEIILSDEFEFKKIDSYYADLLNKPLLENELSLIHFSRYLNAKEGMGDIKTYIEYFSLKKNLKYTFQDRMIYLIAEVCQQKTFLSDKSIRDLLSMIDALIKEGVFKEYIENGKIENDKRITENKLFQKTFPTEKTIIGFTLKDYLNFKAYIESELNRY